MTKPQATRSATGLLATDADAIKPRPVDAIPRALLAMIPATHSPAPSDATTAADGVPLLLATTVDEEEIVADETMVVPAPATPVGKVRITRVLRSIKDSKGRLKTSLFERKKKHVKGLSIKPELSIGTINFFDILI
jgi:hypothetical protein